MDQIKGHVTGGGDDFADLSMSHRVVFLLPRLILLRGLGDNKSASRVHSIDRNFREDETIVNESLRVVIVDDERPAIGAVQAVDDIAVEDRNGI